MMEAQKFDSVVIPRTQIPSCNMMRLHSEPCVQTLFQDAAALPLKWRCIIRVGKDIEMFDYLEQAKKVAEVAAG